MTTGLTGENEHDLSHAVFCHSKVCSANMACAVTSRKNVQNTSRISGLLLLRPGWLEQLTSDRAATEAQAVGRIIDLK